MTDTKNPFDGGSSSDPLDSARRALGDMDAQMRAEGDSAAVDGARLAGLLNVVELINADLNVERVLQTAARQIIDVFECERVFVAELSPGDAIRFLLAVDFRGEPIAAPETEVSHAIMREVARTRGPSLVADATDDPRFANVSSVQLLHLHSVMAAPLLARGSLFGVLYADNRSLPGAFTERSLHHLALLANHIAIALRNARLFRELDDARTELAQAERLKALGQLAAYIAHEIKNPLSSIQILVDGLRDRWDDPAHRERVISVVPEEVKRLSAAVKRILDYARPTRLIRVPLQLGPLMQSVHQTLASQAERWGVDVTEKVEPELPRVLADGERIREVLVNLTRNAMEAVREADRKSVRVTIERADDRTVTIRVEDSGPGIPEEDLDTLFEPFRTKKTAGTGLGLAFCRKVVREHGGSIIARNRPNDGAMFLVTLPIQGE